MAQPYGIANKIILSKKSKNNSTFHRDGYQDLHDDMSECVILSLMAFFRHQSPISLLEDS